MQLLSCLKLPVGKRSPSVLCSPVDVECMCTFVTSSTLVTILQSIFPLIIRFVANSEESIGHMLLQCVSDF